MSSEEWFVRDRNRVTGPFTRDQLDAMRRRGQIARFHQVSQDRKNWVGATTLWDAVGTGGGTIALELDPISSPAAPPAADAGWYYASAKGPTGPIGAEPLLNLLRTGVIHSETLVWREGLPAWIALRDSGLLLSGPPAGAVTSPAGQGKSKAAAALFALFLGGIGVHKFYLGGWGWGIVYLLTFWTLIPAFIAFIEFIGLLAMSNDEFDRRYNRGTVTAFTW